MCARGGGARALLHVNLLLTVLAGAMVSTGARLLWDPSTYVAARALLPGEARGAAVALPAAAAALLALAHLAAHAARPARPRLLRLYAAGMGCLMCLEVAGAWWVAARAAAWLRGGGARQLRDAAELRDQLRALLHSLARWHDLPKRLDAVIEEAEADLPLNLYAAAGAAAALLALQVAAIALALLLAAAPPAPPAARRASPSSSRTDAEEATPLTASAGAGGSRGRQRAAQQSTARHSTAQLDSAC